VSKSRRVRDATGPPTEKITLQLNTYTTKSKRGTVPTFQSRHPILKLGQSAEQIRTTGSELGQHPKGYRNIAGTWYGKRTIGMSSMVKSPLRGSPLRLPLFPR
jgi:hypothetical protein